MPAVQLSHAFASRQPTPGKGTSSNFCGFGLGWEHCSTQGNLQVAPPAWFAGGWRFLSSSFSGTQLLGDANEQPPGCHSVQESLPNRYMYIVNLKLGIYSAILARRILFKDRNVDPFTK